MSNTFKLDLLRDVLIQSGISQRDFSLNGYSDDRVCLERKGKTWQVYMCERGEKFDLYENENFTDVISNFVDRLVDTKKLSNKIISKYKSELVKYESYKNVDNTGLARGPVPAIIVNKKNLGSIESISTYRKRSLMVGIKTSNSRMKRLQKRKTDKKSEV